MKPSRRGERGISPGTDKDEIVAAIPAACSDELTAVEFFERQRWGEATGCPRCGDTAVYQLRDRKTGGRHSRFLWACQGCKQQYTVRIGTILEDSRIPLRHWAYGFWAACSSKKGVSALQIKRQTGLSYKSALFLMHRIRYAMATDHGPLPRLDGTVEIDETYVGGKPRKKTRRERPEQRYKFRPGRAPDFEDRKTPVVAMVERGGHVRAMVMDRVTSANLAEAIQRNMAPSARLMTDEAKPYTKIGRTLAAEHHTVAHSREEYARGDVHTNTVEGFFSLLKRGVYGTFHSVSKKHLHRYVAEFEFRYNGRSLKDGERTALAIQQAIGKRLTYRSTLTPQES